MKDTLSANHTGNIDYSHFWFLMLRIQNLQCKNSPFIMVKMSKYYFIIFFYFWLFLFWNFFRKYWFYLILYSNLFFYLYSRLCVDIIFFWQGYIVTVFILYFQSFLYVAMYKRGYSSKSKYALPLQSGACWKKHFTSSDSLETSKGADGNYRKTRTYPLL